jgi:hypothetical protein
MEARSDKLMAPRKKIRKGVHSCQECRRRKVRCLFASARDTVCITCTRRGSRCLSQANLDDAHIDRAVVTGNDGNAPRSETSTGHGASPNDTSTSTSLNTSSAWHGLQSPSLSSYTTTPPANVITQAVPAAKVNTVSAVREALLLSLPSAADVSILLRNTKNNSAFCSSNRTRNSSALEESLGEAVATKNLLNPEQHPVLLARQMLQLATSLQHISPRTVLIGLSKSHHDIVQGLAESAITLVNNNDALVGTIEGLDNIVLEGYFHIDCGNLRRAWLTMRRAVTVAQLLGLHRPGVRLFKVLDQHSDLEHETMWSNVIKMERVLSLLLGLPTSVSATDDTPNEEHMADEPNLSAILGNWTARILNRNQITSSQEALELTTQIDKDIVKVSEQMPSSFWQPPALEGLEKDSPAALRESKRAFDHMCYYILIIQLHLPHMLCPSHASQRMYSKIACVNASREILLREISLRSLNPISASCRMADFLALIAGMTLILAHAVSHCGKETINMLAHQRLADRETVKRTLDCLQSMSELHQDVLAVRCVTLLGDLLAIEEDAARGSKGRSSEISQEEDTNNTGRNVLIMRVPYLGAIQISRNGIANVAPLGTKQSPGFGEGVTIGGIGSLHINSSISPGDASRAHLSDGQDAQPAEILTSNFTPLWTQTASHTIPNQHNEEIYPDAAAGMDDWVFQGLDTAFFDNLMHEAGDFVSYDGELAGAGSGFPI